MPTLLERAPVQGVWANAAAHGVQWLVTGVAVVLLVAASVGVGVARSSYSWHLYVSELGADGQPTQTLFRISFVAACVGIALVAWVLRDVRTAAPVLRWWPPAASLAVAAAMLFAASQVNCTEGCPNPLDAGSTVRDVVHIVVAVAGFVAGCWAMLQFAGTRERAVRWLSVAAGLLVGGIAATGGIISLADGNTDIGSVMEYVAAGIGTLWLAAVAVAHAARGHTDRVTLSPGGLALRAPRP